MAEVPGLAGLPPFCGTGHLPLASIITLGHLYLHAHTDSLLTAPVVGSETTILSRRCLPDRVWLSHGHLCDFFPRGDAVAEVVPVGAEDIGAAVIADPLRNAKHHLLELGLLHVVQLAKQDLLLVAALHESPSELDAAFKKSVTDKYERYRPGRTEHLNLRCTMGEAVIVI